MTRIIERARHLHEQLKSQMESLLPGCSYSDSNPFYSGDLRSISSKVLEVTALLFKNEGFYCTVQEEQEASCLGSKTVARRLYIVSSEENNMTRQESLKLASYDWEGFSSRQLEEALYGYLKQDLERVGSTRDRPLSPVYESPSLSQYESQLNLLKGVAKRFFKDYTIQPGTQLLHHVKISRNLSKWVIHVPLYHQCAMPPRGFSYTSADLASSSSSRAVAKAFPIGDGRDVVSLTQ